MTFKLYRVEFNDHFYYDYSINDLAGAHDNKLLATLVAAIYDTPSLILASCTDFTDLYINIGEGHKVVYPPVFIATYRDSSELRANLRIDLQRVFPEEFV